MFFFYISGEPLQIDNIFLEKTASTNTYAKENVESFDANNITCITTKEQTAGRGQFAKSWYSPPGKNLLTPFYFTLSKNQKDIEHLAQLMAQSVAKILLQMGFSPQFKWPNDLLLCQKKVCGVLAEITQQKELIYVFIGVGLNINMGKEDLEQIDQPATSLLAESEKTFSIEEILLSLQEQFSDDLALFKKRGFSPFLEFINDLLDQD